MMVHIHAFEHSGFETNNQLIDLDTPLSYGEIEKLRQVKKRQGQKEIEKDDVTMKFNIRNKTQVYMILLF